MGKTATAMGKGLPYKLSWIDRFNNWVEKLPLRARIFYVVVGWVLIVVQVLILWLEGGLQALALLPVILFNGLFVPFLFGAFIYHTVRQLHLVNTINLNHVRISSLFHLKPLQAFSRLTASTAVALVVGIYGWLLINPDLLTDPIIFAAPKS